MQKEKNELIPEQTQNIEIKKQWESPVLVVISVSNTDGGGDDGLGGGDS